MLHTLCATPVTPACYLLIDMALLSGAALHAVDWIDS